MILQQSTQSALRGGLGQNSGSIFRAKGKDHRSEVGACTESITILYRLRGPSASRAGTRVAVSSANPSRQPPVSLPPSVDHNNRSGADGLYTAVTGNNRTRLSAAGSSQKVVTDFSHPDAEAMQCCGGLPKRTETLGIAAEHGDENAFTFDRYSNAELERVANHAFDSGNVAEHTGMLHLFGHCSQGVPRQKLTIADLQSPPHATSYMCEAELKLGVSDHQVDGEPLVSVRYTGADGVSYGPLLLPEGIRANGLRYASEFASLHLADGRAYFEITDNPFVPAVKRIECRPQVDG